MTPTKPGRGFSYKRIPSKRVARAIDAENRAVHYSPEILGGRCCAEAIAASLTIYGIKETWLRP
jgi:hypothetical protein